MNISVVIPNYNGAGIIEKCLDSVTGFFEVIVVDDGSADDSVSLIKSRYPDVKLIENGVNKGFSHSVNRGIRAAEGDFVFLLNTDVILPPNVTDNMLPLFEDSDVFAVSPRIILPKKGDIDEGCKWGKWHNGVFYTDQRQNVTEVTPILYATGCAALYRKSMLDALGGFDEVYSPFYWEDADLGYRAWKRGYKSLYTPHSFVTHEHGATTSKANSDYKNTITARNMIYFIRRNISDKDILKVHKRMLPLVLLKKLLTGDTAFVKGLRKALKSENALPVGEDTRKLSDRKIFEICGITLP
ncbi:MAG: glycosyltransferase family 2 protein [Abditibacteriota bacterium]|nr:glycosyltransferase family 2 protein [Abditibacteriota bacterium]